MSVVDPVTPTPEPAPTPEPSLTPTRKWWVTQITALAALAVMYVTTGSWDLEESVAAIGLVSQAALGWLTRNEPSLLGTGVKSKVS